ncbi:MAG: hypothetical protein OXC42_03410 [Gammaproteobacteria bacterium]|nr:hypothetical protein [Gammaproteobacteria bacterium]
MMRGYKHITTLTIVSAYKATSPIFGGLLSEMRELSKKKPDETLNKNKVKILNRVLQDLHTFLKDEPEGKYLDLLDDEDLPQNSDAVLAMVQYEKALGEFYERYHNRILGEFDWVTEEKLRELEEDAEE